MVGGMFARLKNIFRGKVLSRKLQFSHDHSTVETDAAKAGCGPF